MYTVLSILFLCVEIILLGTLGYFVFKKKASIDKQSLIYLLPVFILVYAIYLTATVYNGTDISFYTLFSLIHKTLVMIAMELNEELVGPLSNANGWFCAATIGACILSFVTVVFSAFVLFGAAFINEIKKRRIFAEGGDVVIGVSPSSLEYISNHKSSVIWAEHIDRGEYLDLIKRGYTVHSAPLTVQSVSRALKGKEHHFIIFRDTNYSCSSVLSCFEQLKAGADKRLFLHLEVNEEEMNIVREKYLSEVSENTNSFVLSFCRYELMARRFIIEHPITKYIPRSFFNENLTLKSDKEINVVFMGFGKVNYELFKLMATNFQFAKQDGDRLYSSPVHYYTLDKCADNFNNEHFIRLLNNYDKRFAESDLPPADKICDLKEPITIDAHSASTRNQIHDIVNENTYTYFVVSMNEDFNDASFAHAIKRSLGNKSNYKIFVRAKDEDGRMINKDDESIVYFGETKKFFSRDNIINYDLMQLSRRVNDLYNDNTHDKWAQLRAWQRLPVIEQYSNIDAALNIYFKLHMLGFELKNEANVGVTKEELKRLVPDAFMGNKGDDYSYFFKTTTANVLAFIEHSRWNAYYLLAGYKPLPFDEFTWKVNSKGYDVLVHKDEKSLRHACLTTYVGLDTLIRHKCRVLEEASKAKQKNVGAYDLNTMADIYRYDYMVIDGMHDALTSLGYSIVKKS